MLGLLAGASQQTFLQFHHQSPHPFQTYIHICLPPWDYTIWQVWIQMKFDPVDSPKCRWKPVFVSGKQFHQTGGNEVLCCDVGLCPVVWMFLSAWFSGASLPPFDYGRVVSGLIMVWLWPRGVWLYKAPPAVGTVMVIYWDEGQDTDSVNYVSCSPGWGWKL